MDDIARFGAYLSDEKHSSRNTVSSYLRDTTQFAEYLHNYCDIDLREADSAAVQDYMDWMLSHGKSAASVTRFLASVKSFYSYMVAAGELKKNPAQGVAAAKVERKYPEILTAKEVELFLEQPECVDAKGFRDHAMLELLYATGIRVSELQFITIEAARCGEAVVSCKAKTRTVFLVKALRQKLLRYAAEQGIESGIIFVTRTGKPVNRTNLWREMKALCAEADVNPQKVFPHNLRHLFARVFYGIEKDIAKLADILGHSSIDTTRIYIISTGTEHRRRMENMHLIL